VYWDKKATTGVKVDGNHMIQPHPGHRPPQRVKTGHRTTYYRAHPFQGEELGTMKLGVFLVLWSDMPFEDALKKAVSKGLQTVEIGTGAYPGDAHCKPAQLLEDPSALKCFREAIADSGLEISALSCHGNPLHPDRAFAESHIGVFHETVHLARELGVKTVVNFSGCPGDSEEAKYPNWVTCPWPDDFSNIVKWQWEEKVIPHWKKEADFLQDHDVRVGLEMHPGFVVYNTETMLRLRKECGAPIGCNFDPSHLVWQGMDPCASIRRLGDSIFHFHAKDVTLDPMNTKMNGVLDTKHYGDEINRSWIFRSLGYGMSMEKWKEMMSQLRLVGYDGPLSIEHEDSLMSADEGLDKAISLLKDVAMFETTGDMHWA